MRPAAPSPPASILTPREIEVRHRVAPGDTNARTARRLSATEGTVKTHVQNILRKPGAANRSGAVSRGAVTTSDRPHLVRAVAP